VSGIRLIVTGMVQGVGFRWFVRQQARRLDLTGWVRNRPEGTVEILAEGPEEGLADLTEAVKRGPSGSLVRSVESQPVHHTGRHISFEITF